MFSVILTINVPIISLYSIKWMVFIMDTDGVLCEVGKEVFIKGANDSPKNVNLYPVGVGF
jgi:hypothetical protein